MTRFYSLTRRALSICATFLAITLLLLGAAAPVTAQQGEPPQAFLQDPPDLVIFHTGEVKGALAAGG